MADTKDRFSDLSGSSGGQRKEDSGLIDLDAILRQGGAAEPAAPSPAAPAVAAPPAAVPVAAQTQRSVGVSTPTPVSSHGYGTADSLDGVASEPARAAAAVTSGPAPVVSAAEAPVVVRSAPPPAAASAPPAAVSVAKASDSPSKGKKRTALTALLLVGVASVAAVFVFRSSQQKTELAPPVDEPVAVAASGAPEPASSAAHTTDGLSLNDLPQAVETAPSADAPRGKPSAHVATTAAQTKPATKPEGKTVLTEKDLAPTGGDPGDLAGAMKDAVGGGNKDVAAKQAAVDANPNARQVRPPPGQVVGAINAVLPGARACLGPDDPVRNGSIVFANDGAVSRVDLSGSKANDACIKSALSKARVQPFSDESFTTRITVRP